MAETKAAALFDNPQSQRLWVSSLALILGLAVLTVFLFKEAAAFTAETWWNSETYAHGVIIFPISIWMFWQRKHAILPVTPYATYWGVWPIFLLSLAWVPGFLANVWLVQQISLVMMVPALAFALLGRKTAMAMLFPLAYLAFAIPIGDSLLEPLMDYTAVFSVMALQWSGIPVFQEGHFISIPSGNFHVAQACSGVRYLIASMALGCLYAYLSYRVWWRRLLFILLALIVPIIANGIRAYAIIMIAHLSDMKLAVGVDHLIFGWVFFAVVMFFMFWLGSLWQEPLEELEAMDEKVEAVAPRADAMSKLLKVTVVLLPLLVSGSLLGRWISDDLATQIEMMKNHHQLGTPAVAGRWQLMEPQPTSEGDWQPQMLGELTDRFAGYQPTLALAADEPQQVLVYLAHYLEQKPGSELINSGNRLFRPTSWRNTAKSEQEMTLPDGSVLKLKELVLRAGFTHRVIWSWYVINEADAINPYYVKWLDVWSAIQGHSGAGVIAVATNYEIREEDARRVLRAFLADMYPSLKASLKQAEARASQFTAGTEN